MKRLLEKASRDGHSSLDVKVGGKLHESAIGSIFFAEALDSKKSVKTCILKTLDLTEQNIWAITLNNSRTTLRGLDAKQVIFMHQDRLEAEEWMANWCDTEERKSARVTKIAWLVQDVEPRDQATKLIRLNEYLCEAMVGLLVSKLNIPNFVKTYDAWISNANGLILQEHGGTNLLKAMPEFTLEEFQSIVVQVLAALAYTQTKIALKHHDMHLENVFVKKLRPWDSLEFTPLKLDSEESERPCVEDSGSFVYTLGPQKISIKHCGLIAKIADFGLSCATDVETKERYERADYALLDASEAEWGSWSSSLKDQYMYDAVVFLSRFFMDEEKTITSPQNIKWAKGLFNAMQSKWPEIECSNIGRPLRRREGREKIQEIFALDYMSSFVKQI